MQRVRDPTRWFSLLIHSSRWVWGKLLLRWDMRQSDCISQLRPGQRCVALWFSLCHLHNSHPFTFSGTVLYKHGIVMAG